MAVNSTISFLTGGRNSAPVSESEPYDKEHLLYNDLTKRLQARPLGCSSVMSKDSQLYSPGPTESITPR